MPQSPRSYALNELSWVEVRDYLTRDTRLIVPVGACDQFGAHLPVGTASRIVETLAVDLSRDFGVLRAPTLHYGVNVPTERSFPGAATLRVKTLHSMLNELVASWEDSGFREFILLTAHSYDSHVEALATVRTAESRIRVIETLNMDLSEHLEGVGGPQHGGEILTSLSLYLYPGSVRMDRVEDYLPRERDRSLPPRCADRIPIDSLGAVGQPSLAAEQKGYRLYEHILQKIRTRVFLAPSDDDGN
jgi:creatinine amidohydrolase